MAAVSGISGAGPLLRRIVLRTAAQITPGVLPSLEALGATRTRVGRVSGQRAVPECPAIDEWFLPGTTPPAGQSWYREGALVLPARYAAWRARSGGAVGDGERVSATGAQADASAPMVELAIESLRHGDRFAMPDGAEAAYATVALRASGKRAAEKLAWSIDGQPFRASRWRLTRGEHTVSVRAPSGVTAVATVMVQ